MITAGTTGCSPQARHSHRLLRAMMRGEPGVRDLHRPSRSPGILQRLVTMTGPSGLSRATIPLVICILLSWTMSRAADPATPIANASSEMSAPSTKHSSSVYFNGERPGSIIRIPFNASQNSYLVTRALTFEAWIKPLRSDVGGAILNKAVGMCKDDWVLGQTASLGLSFHLANSCTGNNRILERANVLTPGQWQHVAGVWDGDSLRLFFNGRQILRSRYSGIPSANSIDMSIGANNHWNGDHLSYRGFIDEVRFSNVARYDRDFIPALRFVSDEHTVLLFHCDEGSGTILYDSSSAHLRAYGESIAWGEDVAGAAPEEYATSADGEVEAPARSSRVWIYLAAVVVLSVGGFLWTVRRRKPVVKSPPDPVQIPPSPTAGVVIEVFGGANIRGRDGVDLTGRFSRRMLELFLIILLHTGRAKGNGSGIQTGTLTAALWPELDAPAAKNARGVAMKRLREILAEVGGIRLVKNQSAWTLDFEQEVTCDIVALMQEFGSANRMGRLSTIEGIERFLDLAGKGRLLPDVDYPWLDPIRSDIDTMVVNSLIGILDMKAGALPETLLIRVAEAGLVYEPVNERFLCAKLSALASLGRLTAAREAFDSFADEYQSIVGSPFPRPFQDCLAG